MQYLISVSSLGLGGGLSRYIFTLCKILAENNEIIVLTTHDGGNTEYAKSELFAISPKIQLISLGEESRLKKYLACLKTIRKIKPDIIINNYNAVIQYLLPFISRKIKVVHILHADIDDFYRVGSINGKNVDGWIAPSQAVADHFNAYTKNRFHEKISLIPHGVDDAELVAKMNHKLEIVFAGVLYEHKGVKILPEIVDKLLENKISFHLTILGQGVLESWLKDRLKEQIEDGIVTLTGVVEHTRVYNEMSKADIFLYPTHLDSFGLVIAEAMINGAVPIVTLINGVTDGLIDDGVDGFLVKQDNIDQFVSRIIELYENPTRRNFLSRKAYQKAFENFTSSVMDQAYRSYFQKLF